MQQLHVQLYGKTATTGYSELLSTSELVRIGLEPTQFELRLEAPEGEKIEAIRLDPDNQPSRFAIIDLAVEAGDGEEIYRWDGSQKSFQMVDLNASRSGGRVIFESTSNDPELILQLPQPQSRICLKCSVMSDLSNVDEQQLVEAILSLQSTLRSALDELTSEQEGLEETVTLNQAQARADVDAINEKAAAVQRSVLEMRSAVEAIMPGVESKITTLGSSLSALQAHFEAVEQSLHQIQAGFDAVELRLTKKVAGVKSAVGDLQRDVGALMQSSFDALELRLTKKVAGVKSAVGDLQKNVGAIEQSLEGKLKLSADETRQEILLEMRDLWRSLRLQINENLDAASRESREREAMSSASLQRDLDRLAQGVDQIVSSQACLDEVSRELGSSHNLDTIAKVQQMKTELDVARGRHEARYSVLLMRRLKSFARALNGK